MLSPAERLPLPLVINLHENPREDEGKRSFTSWVLGPMLKMVNAFNASLKAHPPIPMGTPDPYRPPAASAP